MGYSPWGRKEVDTAEQLTPLIHLSHFIFTFVIINELIDNMGFSGSSAGKESACDTETWVRKIPWRREQLPTPVFLPGEFHGQRSLAGYSPWCPKESDMNGFHFTLKILLTEVHT